MNSFVQAIQQQSALIPLAGDPLIDWSVKRRAEWLRGFDSVTILEAASEVLADIENKRFDAVLRRFSRTDQASINEWRAWVWSQGINVAPTPVHPLALLAATTLALGQSVDGQRSDLVRTHIASRLVEVGLRFNGPVVGESTADDDVLAAMSRASIWRAFDDHDWMLWSAEVTRSLETLSIATVMLQDFQSRNGLSLSEWFCRGLGERSTRAVHGAKSWGLAADQVDPRIESAWSDLSSIKVEDAVRRAKAALTTDAHGHLHVSDPFNLHFLSTKHLVQTQDDRRFHTWIGAQSRLLLPAGVAQAVADTTTVKFDNAAEVLGRAAEPLLIEQLDRVPLAAGEQRIAETKMPSSISKCDYLIETDDLLVGLEFTLKSPSRALVSGSTDAIRDLVGLVAGKLGQIYSTFEWRDKAQKKRRLPVVVFVSPTVVEALFNERVHEHACADPDNPTPHDSVSEVMTAGAPAFLDLLQWCVTSGTDLSTALLDWRDGVRKGVSLDFWLSDRGAFRSSGKVRIDEITDWVATTLQSM